MTDMGIVYGLLGDAERHYHLASEANQSILATTVSHPDYVLINGRKFSSLEIIGKVTRALEDYEREHQEMAQEIVSRIEIHE